MFAEGLRIRLAEVRFRKGSKVNFNYCLHFALFQVFFFNWPVIKDFELDRY